MTQTISPQDIVIKQRIGSGTFSDVYKANLAGKKLAFKKLKIDPEINFIEPEILREISLLKLLTHKPISINLITAQQIVYGKDSKGNICIGYTMDIFTKDLHDCITEKLFSYEDKINIANDLFKALYFLHSNKIIHRDIKPDNIFIDHNKRAFLGDYSLSKVFSNTYKDGTHTSKIATTTYRAPEVVKGKKYNHKADIWSLGVSLFELYKDSMLDMNDDNKTLKYLENEVSTLENCFLCIIIKECLKVFPSRRLNLKKALMYKEFNNNPNDIKQIGKMCWEMDYDIDISDEVQDMAENFDIEKEITKKLAQKIINKTSYHAHGSISLAAKFYETEPIEDIIYDVEEYYDLFKSMDFNLYL
jgi:serine/threonine protein kinase